jgi:MinD superfamily P-loop ATPase
VKQIVVVSGKGGTGKTSLTGSFCWFSREGDAIYADCDVDASNLHLILSPEKLESGIFTGGRKARIVPEECTSCGRCLELCRFDAVEAPDGGYRIDETACEGCGVCYRACPAGAIRFEPADSGEWFRSITPYGELFHARLYPGEENSGKLVTLVKKKAEERAREIGAELLLVDGPPGTACPVLAALTGADLAVVVAEPTVSSMSDMERITGVIRHFEMPFGVLINKSTLNEENRGRIEAYCRNEEIPLFGSIPFHPNFHRAVSACKPYPEFTRDEIHGLLEAAWSRIREAAGGEIKVKTK